MTVGNKNQMIDQIDVRCPQEKRGIMRGGDVGIARPGGARRMVVRHHDGYGSFADQCAPASRRHGAATWGAAIDALETGEAAKGVEPGEDHAFAVVGELRTQEFPRDRIFGIARNETAMLGGNRTFFPDGLKDRHHRAMAQQAASPNVQLPRNGRTPAAAPAPLLSARGAQPSNGREIKGARLG